MYPRIFQLTDPDERPATGVAPWDTPLVDSLNEDIGSTTTLSLPCEQRAYYNFDPGENPLLYKNMSAPLRPFSFDCHPQPAYETITPLS
jgi:hypothetical protein